MREKDDYVQEAGEHAGTTMRLQRDLEAITSRLRKSETSLSSQAELFNTERAGLQKQIEDSNARSSARDLVHSTSAAEVLAKTSALRSELDAVTSELTELRKNFEVKDEALMNQQKQIENFQIKSKNAEKALGDVQSLKAHLEHLQNSLTEKDDIIAHQKSEKESAASEHKSVLEDADEHLASLTLQIAQIESEAQSQLGAVQKKSDSLVGSLRLKLEKADAALASQGITVQALREELEKKEAMRSRSAATIKAANLPPDFSALHAKIQAVSTRSGVSTPVARSLSSSTDSSSTESGNDDRHTKAFKQLSAELLLSQTDLGLSRKVVEEQKEKITKLEQDIAEWREVSDVYPLSKVP